MPSDYANDLMARVGLDTTEWKKGITDLNAGIKHIETGFQATAALMDDWSNSSEGLKKRVESLNDKLALQKQKLDILKKAYEEEVAANGEGSKAAEELAKKMYAVKNEIDRTKASLDKYGQAEDEATKKAKVMIAQLEKSGQKIAATGDKISSIGNKMTVGITTPILAAGTAIYKYSSDLNEAENKTDATFGSMSDKIHKWAESSLDAFGMAKSTAYDAVSLYGDMATSMGLGKSAAADMSMSLVELSADLSSFKNVSLEQSQSALKGIFTGETESLKNLGIVMTETQLKAYAMSEGFEKNYEDMTQAEKIQLRYQFLLESSANAIGDYSKTSGEAAGQMRKLPEALKELASSFRDNVEPSITPIIAAVNNAVVAFGKLGDGTKDTIVKLGLVAAVAGPLVTVVGKTVTVYGKAKIALAKHRAELLKKTAATVADTTAEGAHSAALTKTATSSTGAAKGLKGIGTAASAAAPYILAVVAALLAMYAIFKKIQSEELDRINTEYEAKTKATEESYNATIQNLEAEKQAKEDYYNTQIEETNKYYDNEIDLLDEKLDATKKAIEKERDLYKKAHEERLKQLEAEKELKLSNIDIEENTQVAAIKKQIDALNALTEADEAAEKERENQKKLTELQNAIRDAETYAEKVDAENEYNDFLRELENERAKEQRQLQIEELENQIETIEKESEAKRDQVNEEYEAAVQLENQKNEIAQQGFEERLEALDGFIESETEKLETAREEKLAILQKETSDYSNEIQKRIDENERLKQAEIAAIEESKAAAEKAATEISTFLYQEKYSNTYSLSPEEIRRDKDKKIWSGPNGEVYGTAWEAAWANLLNGGGGVGANASGTNFWRGGLTRINEEGGEILNLPRGTQIIPHDVSMEMARAAGSQVANNTTTNSTTNNSYNYGARQQVTVLQIGNKTVAKEIVPAASVLMSDSIYGRRRSGGEIKRI